MGCPPAEDVLGVGRNGMAVWDVCGRQKRARPPTGFAGGRRCVWYRCGQAREALDDPLFCRGISIQHLLTVGHGSAVTERSLMGRSQVSRPTSSDSVLVIAVNVHNSQCHSE